MKKLLSLVIVLALVLGMGVGVFAEEHEDMDSIQIEKNFLVVNEGSVNPEETFEFLIEKDGVRDSQYDFDDMPMFNPASFVIDFDEEEAGLDKSYELNLPVYEHVGVFTYKITEVEGNTAGLVYDDRDLILTVYVFNDGDGGLYRAVTLHDEVTEEKETGFYNDFESGNLEIYKDVTGNMGEQDRDFNITVLLNGPEGKDITNVSVKVDGEDVAFDDNMAQLDLTIRHDQTIVISNLPYGTGWAVSEEDLGDEGYETTIEVNDGSIDGSRDQVNITNHKEQAIETGINLDNLPYILILGLATIGLFGFSMKRRFNK